MFYTRGHCGFGTRVTHGPGFRLLRPREGPRGAGLQTSPRRDQMRVSPPKHEVPTQQAGGGARQPQASGSGKEVHRDRKPRQKGHPPPPGQTDPRTRRGHWGPSDLVLTADRGSRQSDCYFSLAGERIGVKWRPPCLASHGRS